MRVVFMGTPQFAVPSLIALAAHHDVVAVYTRPDAVSGRGGKLRPCAVKAAALELGLEVVDPASLRDHDAIARLQALQADLIIVAAYGLILAPDVLEAGALGAVNVHASLLPRWRGAAPIQRAILAGDTVTGVSIMRMEAGLDTGPYCAQARLSLDDLTTPEATDLLADLGAETLLAALPAIAGGSAVWITQDETLVTYADKVAKSDVAVAPDLPAETIVRRVRASSPTAPSGALIAGRRVTLLDAHVTPVALGSCGVACTKTALVLGASDGAVEIRRVKPDGKAEMDACAWARGVRDLDDAQWGACA